MLDLIKRLFKIKTKTTDPDPGQNKPNQTWLFMPELNQVDTDNTTDQESSNTNIDSTNCKIDDEENQPSLTSTRNISINTLPDKLYIHILNEKITTTNFYPNNTSKKIDTNKNFTNNIPKNLKSQYSQRYNRYPYLPKSYKLNDYHYPTPSPALRKFEEVKEPFSCHDIKVKEPFSCQDIKVKEPFSCRDIDRTNRRGFPTNIQKNSGFNLL